MKLFSALCSCLLIANCNIAFAKKLLPQRLNISTQITVYYQCDNGEKIRASYYNLSDDSLSFVKLTLKGTPYTLPALISASGVRYTDEHQVEWWQKGNEVMLDEDVRDDKSPLSTCTEMLGVIKKQRP
jgi:membrane-bound inhibitor of C-type lysozyme